jgi:hypothetical protein
VFKAIVEQEDFPQKISDSPEVIFVPGKVHYQSHDSGFL